MVKIARQIKRVTLVDSSLYRAYFVPSLTDQSGKMLDDIWWGGYFFLPSSGNCWRHACKDPIGPAVSGEVHNAEPGGPLPPGPIPSCKWFMNRVTGSNPKIMQPGPNGKCPRCHYRVLVVLRGRGPEWTDFHFYTETDDGLWESKSGHSGVKIFNTQDITSNPRDTICGYVCMPESGINVDINNPKVPYNPWPPASSPSGPYYDPNIFKHY